MIQYKESILYFLYLLAGKLISSYAFHERDSMWVKLIGLVSLIDDGKRNSKTKPLEVSDLLSKGDRLWSKVHLEF